VIPVHAILFNQSFDLILFTLHAIFTFLIHEMKTSHSVVSRGRAEIVLEKLEKSSKFSSFSF
jgi:hypothetical protein